MIPKRIIQTWKSRKIPVEFRRYQKQIRKLNTDYEYLLFTDEDVNDFIAAEYPQFFEAFDSCSEFIFKADLFRLLAVHKLGGFYLDLDVFQFNRSTNYSNNLVFFLSNLIIIIPILLRDMA